MKHRGIMIFLLFSFFCVGGTELTLTQNGKSNYSVELNPSATDADRLALKELQEAFSALTSLPLTEQKSAGPVIFIGTRPADEKKLAADEFVTRSVGSDIYLYGEGKWGNLYAVYAFIEDQLGGRYYSVSEGLFLRKNPTKKLRPFAKRYQYPVRSRRIGMAVPRYDERFLYRNRENSSLRDAFGISRDTVFLSPSCHSFYFFIPPGGAKVVGSNPDAGKRGYFAEHPEFFSLDKNGKRGKTQLCLSNKNMRKELIRTIDEVIRKKLPDAEKFKKKIIDFSANDMGGRFCWCPECVALEKKYGCPGGPLFDCIVEVCNAFKEKHPDVTFSTLLYRREQTQKPPQGLVFPKNFEGCFAPIHDNFLGSLSDACNEATRKDLEKWCSIAAISIWYYPGHYSSAFHTSAGFPPPPLGHAERIDADMKLFATLGISSIYVEHDSGTACNANFADMIGYLCLKLMQNPKLDANALIEEYMRDNYGAAAPLMLAYFKELETYRKKLLAEGVWFNYMPRLGQYTSYMTPSNLVRWQKQFDAMEKLAGKEERVVQRIQEARLSIDLGCFADFRRIAAAFPEFASEKQKLKNRILSTVDRANRERIPEERYARHRLNIRSFLEEMEQEPKPLPELFASIPAERILQINPDSPRRLAASRKVVDRDAAWEVAGREFLDAAAETHTVGFYDYWNKTTPASLAIDLKSVKPGYHFYKIGTVTLTQNCLFFTEKWNVTVYADHLYSFDEPDLNYDAYLSLKFSKNAAGEKQVFCDRIVLVRK